MDGWMDGMTYLLSVTPIFDFMYTENIKIGVTAVTHGRRGLRYVCKVISTSL